VRVVARVPGDNPRGQRDTVYSTYADAGDMMHVVQFADGQMAHYYFDELKSIRNEPTHVTTETTPHQLES
jgi:hypothetical protein